ncbi:hypothetical protein VHEMI01150 [[Torrubiella] hemipterigena]|uniref:CN hydrolase domain-containing protein n=1 Tax=[Torrubiella] hemipterigena TaxID=1531966 RepID=A0A0A1T4F3_9HYPO|nr:hypothetical protein VHEMI01150 [[Torrubiella] hemipterigena]
MKIACLQHAPKVAEIEDNIDLIERILDKKDVDTLDLLVLPELALTGYNFKSRSEILRYVEPSNASLSVAWAKKAALKYDCIVIVGYPEQAVSTTKKDGSADLFNSAIIVDGDGEIVGNYRKNHLYYTDETWAEEGKGGFYSGHLPGIGQSALGICMDLNPYKFEAPWTAYEFASHAKDTEAQVVILTMAWNTMEPAETFLEQPDEPDMETLSYWLSRLQPLLGADARRETIVVFANRAGREGDATYAGTSAVVGIQGNDIRVYGMVGRGEERLLVVDTDLPAYAKLRFVAKEKVDSPGSSPANDEEAEVGEQES